MYFALKAVKFDQNYSRGQEIPEEVISFDMVEKLISCGVIQKVGGTEEKTETDKLSKEKVKVVKQSKKV